ncbi:Uma2 family endonuclease [Archangium lansingense]|uniref:Uma2 family endonuclease n=1 Tax=Archangium lansingense TaxID=2995310 RepID=A0ABT4AP83_9BACT|nr:Uma2 family endonuclease [Archangium lansinium]MCY1083488.1 Uma2 family endonuclease [Archangium lansinium]
MSMEERERVVESLPAEVTWDEMAMPEGDLHSEGKRQALGALRGYFKQQRRRVYVGTELPIYYPGERRFAPDLLVVLDADPHLRGKWVVSREGKGLDWVMEVHVGGDRKKDAEYNVRRYARLGIPGYFIYDRARERLEAYRLPSPEAREYVRIEPRHGRYPSEVLGLELQLDEERLRFWAGNALLLEPEEMNERLRGMLDGAQRRADEEARQRAEEVRRREEAERRLAELQVELERLKSRGE